jgi:NADH-quinone oxidoreductase subunit A
MERLLELWTQGELFGSGYPAIYLSVLLFTAVALVFGFGTLILAYFLRPSDPHGSKGAPYECGSPPIGDTREQQVVRFFVVAMMFVLFDVETVFIFPWAVAYGQLGLFGLVEMGLFIGILLLGYVYIWKKGALRWV